MSELRILHAADLHLDSPFEGLPAGKAALRRGEQRELLGRLAELARQEQGQLVLAAGDPPRRYEAGKGPAKLEGCVFEIDTETGRCLSAEGVRLT